LDKLSTLDFITVGIIALAFIGIPFLAKNSEKGLFTMSHKLPWIFSAASIFVIYWNPTMDMVNTRLVVENGYSGLWFLKDILLTIGIGPVLFVPMWARLNITTDNQIIPLRFSGIGATLLQKFRAIYVGIFVAAILCSFYTLGIYKLVKAFFPITDTLFFTLFGLTSLLLILKNSLSIKVKSDLIVSILFLVVIPLGLYFLIDSLGGWLTMKGELMTNHADKIALFPTDGGNGESWANVIVFLSIQWWSARIQDQSSVNTQRYFAIKDPWKAFKSIFIPVVVISITFAFSSFIWDAALISHVQMEEAETSYVLLLTNALPAGIKGALLITFVLGFVTSFEAIMSWGAGMVTYDLFGNSSFAKKVNINFIGYLSMGLIALSSLLIAIFSSEIYFLITLLLSISIGVGPVYILRWFWWRINAWSQLSAMIASFIFAVSADWLYAHYPLEYIRDLLLTYDMSWYVLKLLLITPIVSVIWLAVTFLTKHDDINHLKKFVAQSQTSGIWPFATAPFHWRKKLIAIILIGLAAIMPIWIIWLFKFQSVPIGLLLSFIWGFILYIAYKLMRSVLMKS
jgi:SSS family solute:Na+ symporter